MPVLEVTGKAMQVVVNVLNDIKYVYIHMSTRFRGC